MVRVPAVEDEDRGRVGRERKVLIEERTLHINRIKGLLFSVGIRGYEPLRRDAVCAWKNCERAMARPLPAHLKGQLRRELDRLELLDGQIKVVEAERDALLSTSR